MNVTKRHMLIWHCQGAWSIYG